MVLYSYETVSAEVDVIHTIEGDMFLVGSLGYNSFSSKFGISVLSSGSCIE
jgi:hypothetical protein